MLKHYRIDATSLTTKEIDDLEKFLDGYAHNIATDCSGTYEILLDYDQPLEGLPQIPANCKITLLSKN